jgi:hypothetical protein
MSAPILRSILETCDVKNREALCKRLFFKRPSHKADLLDPTKTQTWLIGHLLYVTQKYSFETTAVKSDHHNDSGLGEYCHFNGYCVDGYPLRSHKANDWMTCESLEFRNFLTHVSLSPYQYQTGIAPASFSLENLVAAGPNAFKDDGADHIHLGSKEIV